MPKISVIVPIYNVEKYLDRCMQSLLNQTLKDIEIIMVDDGSPDNCPKMCDEYARRDSRIKVIHKNNEGLGYARNSGLDIATGEYIAFVDSDDFVDKTIYQELYNCALTNCSDIVYCSYYLYDENKIKKIKYPRKIIRINGYKQCNDFLENLISADYFNKNDIHISCSVWKAIYKRNIIESNHIRFCSERTFISEDIIFHIDFLNCVKSIIVLSQCLYYYCLNAESLTKKYSEGRFIKDIVLCEEVERKLNLVISKDKARSITNSLIFEKLQGTLSFEINSCPPNILHKISECCRNYKLKQALDEINLKKLPIKKRLFLFCVKHKLSLIILFYYKFFSNGNR